MSVLRQFVPSMYHRRLLLLMSVIVFATALLGGQLYRLTVVQGEMWREEAESVLSSRRLLPTVRGRILDRTGRVLAEDRPCYDVAVEFEVITGEWAYEQARDLAFADYSEVWGQLSFDEREAIIAVYQDSVDEQVDAMWELLADVGGVSLDEIEERKRTIVERVQTIRAEVWDRRARQRAAEREGPVELRDVTIAIAEEREEHTILAAVDDDSAHEIRKVLEELPGVSLTRSRTREYPLDEIIVDIDLSTMPGPLRRDEVVEVRVERPGASLLGEMRDRVWAEDMERRPYRRPGGGIDLGGYLPGDSVGHRGMESMMEDHLRGVRGEVIQRRDTGEEQRTPPEPGGDVHLTLDMALQVRVGALMDGELGLTRVQPWHENPYDELGTELYGGAVVMEIDSGDILAMVSKPNPEEDAWDMVLGKPVAPGSTMKPIIYSLAASEGHVGINQVIECRGHFLENNNSVYRCWIYRPPVFATHGELAPVQAIAQSCNIYFYQCGRNMGAETLVGGLQRWGFGERTGLLPVETGGLMPRLTGVNPPGRQLSLPNAIMMGIGQGPIAVPPIQVASGHAALARGGYWLSPVLVDELRHEQQSRELRVPPPAIANVMQGMYESTYGDRGTGSTFSYDGERERIITLDDVTVRSKTGTAQVRRPIDLENGERDVVTTSHAWYVAHVAKPGEDRASYIVVVMLEYGGSGGRVAGPVVNQILHAMRDEGYL